MAFLFFSICLLNLSTLFFFFFTRQTSDPRSGFATVEKDLPGGLTPMLGDRKVITLNLFVILSLCLLYA